MNTHRSLWAIIALVAFIAVFSSHRSYAKDNVKALLSDLDGPSMIQVIAPQGGVCRMGFGRGQSEPFYIPFAWKPRPKQQKVWISCKLPNGAIWQRFVALQRAQTTVIQLQTEENPPTQLSEREQHLAERENAVMVKEAELRAKERELKLWESRLNAREKGLNLQQQKPAAKTLPKPVPPKPVPQKPKPQVWAQSDFNKLKAAVQKATFASDKLALIRSAIHGPKFITMDQLGALVDLLAHSDDKIQAVQICKSHVIDPQNAYQLAQHFSFSDDREKVLNLFAH